MVNKKRRCNRRGSTRGRRSPESLVKFEFSNLKLRVRLIHCASYLEKTNGVRDINMCRTSQIDIVFAHLNFELRVQYSFVKHDLINITFYKLISRH